MGKVTIFLPFEVVGRILGGVVQGVVGGVQVVAEAMRPDEIPPPAPEQLQEIPPGQAQQPMPTPISNPIPPVGVPRATRPSPDQYREVVVEPGEYLVDIASRELGRADRWREIAALNQIEDTRLVKAGQTLLLPE